MKNISKYLMLSALLLNASVSFAISDGIRKDRDSECAIWLCLPGGFIAGCEAAFNAYLGRITDLTYKGGRKYTDLPAFAYCMDIEPLGTGAFASNQVTSTSQMNYLTVYEIHQPQYNIATRWDWAYRKGKYGFDRCDKVVEEDGYNVCYIKDFKYCAAVQTVSAKIFESDTNEHYYKTINIGSRAYTAEKRMPYRQYTAVLVDGKEVGERFYTEIKDE